MAAGFARPYQLEPECSSSEDSGEEDQFISFGRGQQDVSEWCTCGHCERMPSEVENVCCREIPQVRRRCDELPDPPQCMVDHPGLEPVCLNPYSLQNALNIYRADYGPLRLRVMTNRYRYLAYRSFVSWCWGFLGRRVRVVIPSCVVLRIRTEYADSTYTGFRPVLD
ncbi:P2X purinoceptor 7-like [Sander lucioperca]|uniref:P2X purinoceptor 7-like n=1 Tax=Sander lucioperca TaxID=283035 RepID=UPI00125DF619|nr:P2X purinoceptor 7-like [Sander lucioperca]